MMRCAWLLFAQRADRASGRVRATGVLLLFVLSISGPARATDTTVAPNTIGPAMARALPAVVKLYGTGLGRAHGYGTGVLVSADGQILTTRSLLTSARSIRAVLADGREFEAKVERDDTYRELALLKIDGANLPHMKPARSDHVQVGDTVLAVGNWFKVADGDEPPSVNRGIFAGRTTLNARRLVQPVDYAGPILVFDAMTANPGAAGGPLLDIDGNFIGLIGKVVESADTNTRPNYALPGEEISDFLGGKASPAEAAVKAGAAAGKSAGGGELGIKLSKLGYRHVSAYVERVRPGSPAAAAGLQTDDLIVAIDGKRIADAEGYDEVVSKIAPGQKVQIVYKRGEAFGQVELTATEKPK